MVIVINLPAFHHEFHLIQMQEQTAVDQFIMYPAVDPLWPLTVASYGSGRGQRCWRSGHVSKQPVGSIQRLHSLFCDIPI